MNSAPFSRAAVPTPFTGWFAQLGNGDHLAAQRAGPACTARHDPSIDARELRSLVFTDLGRMANAIHGRCRIAKQH